MTIQLSYYLPRAPYKLPALLFSIFMSALIFSSFLLPSSWSSKKILNSSVPTDRIEIYQVKHPRASVSLMKKGENALSLNDVLRPQRKKDLPPKTLRSTSSLIAEEAVSLVERTEHTAESDKLSDKESDKPSRIKFDSKALAEAMRDSRTEIQKMADAKGQRLMTSRATKYMEFQLAAGEAAIPSCTGKESLKHDPIPVSGFSVSLSGLLALPHLAHAALTGKCR